ncbi:hypothetical protein [Mycobacterium sp.]|nr:hypothetical protein [Mycobacterium sp.]
MSAHSATSTAEPGTAYERAALRPLRATSVPTATRNFDRRPR